MACYRGKRFFDLALILISSPVFLPLLVVTAAAVRLFIGAPVFFRQKRPGRYGQPFDLIKFRTMTTATDSEGVLLPDADRLTSFGRLLRSSSLDEVPELINVLRGEMSFVGPRPLLEEYIPLYSVRQRRRHDVMPGLTGLAQASGRNALSWAERFELDVAYVERCSFKLDLMILLRTIGLVLTGHGVTTTSGDTMPPFMGNE